MNVAHISDLHLRHHLPGTSEITSRRSRDMPDRFAAAIAQIAAAAPDLLVISGDLLDYPLDKLNDPETLAQGEQDLRLIGEILDELTCPVALIHGNHDHPVLVRSVFGHLPMEQTVAGHRVLCFYDDEDIDHVPRRLGPSLQRFQAALSHDDPMPQIHVQHYVIWPLLNDDYPHTYYQGAWLRQQITSSDRVRLVLSGHYHKGVPLFQIDSTFFAVSRAFAEEPHPYCIYTLDGDTVTCAEYQLT